MFRPLHPRDRASCSLVCSYWRETSIQSPELWDAIEYRASSQGDGRHPSLNVLFERAKSLPPALRLIFPPGTSATTVPHIVRELESRLKYLRRLDIQVNAMFPEINELASYLNQSAPALEFFLIKVGQGQQESSFFHLARYLHSCASLKAVFVSDRVDVVDGDIVKQYGHITYELAPHASPPDACQSIQQAILSQVRALRLDIPRYPLQRSDPDFTRLFIEAEWLEQFSLLRSLDISALPVNPNPQLPRSLKYVYWDAHLGLRTAERWRVLNFLQLRARGALTIASRWFGDFMCSEDADYARWLHGISALSVSAVASGPPIIPPSRGAWQLNLDVRADDGRSWLFPSCSAASQVLQREIFLENVTKLSIGVSEARYVQHVWCMPAMVNLTLHILPGREDAFLSTAWDAPKLSTVTLCHTSSADCEVLRGLDDSVIPLHVDVELARGNELLGIPAGVLSDFVAKLRLACLRTLVLRDIVAVEGENNLLVSLGSSVGDVVHQTSNGCPLTSSVPFVFSPDDDLCRMYCMR